MINDLYKHIYCKYFAKDLISIHEILKKLSKCAQFGECAFCGDIIKIGIFSSAATLILKVVIKLKLKGL